MSTQMRGYWRICSLQFNFFVVASPQLSLAFLQHFNSFWHRFFFCLCLSKFHISLSIILFSNQAIFLLKKKIYREKTKQIGNKKLNLIELTLSMFYIHPSPNAHTPFRKLSFWWIMINIFR